MSVYRYRVMLMGLFCVAVAWAQEPPAPKVRRIYNARVNLQQPATAPVLPQEQEEVAGQASAGLEAAAPEAAPVVPAALGPERLPATLPATPRENLSREKDQDDLDPRSILGSAPADKPSGWGWLADEVLKSSALTSGTHRTASADSGEEDPWSPSGESSSGSTASSREKDLDEERWSATENRGAREEAGRDPERPSEVAWRPLGWEDKRGVADPSLSMPEETGRGPVTGGLTGFTYDAPAQSLSERPLVDAYVEEAVRAEAMRPASRGEAGRMADGPGSFLDSRERFGSASGLAPLGHDSRPEPGLFAPAAPSLGPAWPSSTPGLSAPAPVFGSLQAVELQPSLAVPAPVTPALTMPSPAPSSPTLGGMGSETEARPRTLPW